MKNWQDRTAILFGLLMGLYLRWIYPNPWIHDGFPFMADGDCYTRLQRVALIFQGKGLIWSFHGFENYPLGIVPHTTFPLDGLIAILTLTLKPFVDFPLDWAGGLISPLLFGVLLIALYFACSGGTRPSRFSFESGYFSFPVLAVGLAVLPGLIWATPFGRPDHQSLVMIFIFLGLLFEPRRWEENAPRWKIGLGILWGCALWVSLYEPLMILGILIGLNLVIRRKEQSLFLGALSGVILLSLLIEGFRFLDLRYLHQKNVSDWFHTIGETRGLSGYDFILIFTVVIFLIPPAIVVFWNRLQDRKTILVLLGLSVVLVGITMAQRRWLYFSPIPPLLLLSLLWKHFQVSWKWGIGLIFAINIVISTHYLKSAEQKEAPLVTESKVIAKSIREPGAIIAPWWISPSLLYYSGQPIVASSSHQSIEGIVDVSRFYLSTSWVEAEQLFQRRKVKWIVSYTEDHVIENASQVLAQEIPRDIRMTWAHRLWNSQALPTSLRLRAVTPHLRLYEFTGSQSAAE